MYKECIGCIHGAPPKGSQKLSSRNTSTREHKGPSRNTWAYTFYRQEKKRVLSMEDIKKMLFVTPNPSREEIDVTLTNRRGEEARLRGKAGHRTWGSHPSRARPLPHILHVNGAAHPPLSDTPPWPTCCSCSGANLIIWTSAYSCDAYIFCTRQWYTYYLISSCFFFPLRMCVYV